MRRAALTFVGARFFLTLLALSLSAVACAIDSDDSRGPLHGNAEAAVDASSNAADASADVTAYGANESEPVDDAASDGATDGPALADVADEGIAADAPSCVDFIDGVRMASLPDLTIASAPTISGLAADTNGVYFSGQMQTCVSTWPCTDVAALYFAAVPGAPPTPIVNALIGRFVLIGANAYYFDDSASLQRIDIAAGTTAATGIVGTQWSGSSIANDPGALYWVVDDAITYVLERSAVAPDGSLGAPTIVRQSNEYLYEPAGSAGGLVWFEGMDAMLLPLGATQPVRFDTTSAADVYLSLAVNDARAFVARNEYGPSIDGGYGTSYPGPFLGAVIVTRPFEAASTEVVMSSANTELGPVLATESTLVWVERVQLPGNGMCGYLWSQPIAGGERRLIASGHNAIVGGLLTAQGDTVYFTDGSNGYTVYRHTP